MRITSWALSLTLVGMLAFAPTVIAQDVEFVEEVVVRGEKRVRTLQDTQSSVALFTEEDITATYTPDLDELIMRAANVNKAFGDAGFAIRGITQNGPTTGLNTISSNLTLGISVDDIPLTTTQQNLLSPTGAWDLGAVEIFRGPQSTVQGRNALAGAMYLYSKEPTEEFSGDFQVVGGEFGTEQYSAAIGGPVIPGLLSFRASFDRQEGDGFTSNDTLNSDEVAGHENDLARLKLVLTPTDDLLIKLTAIHSDQDGTSFQGFQLDEFERSGERVNNIDNPQRRYDDSLLLGGRVDWSLNTSWTVSSLTSWVDSESGRTQDGDGTPAPLAIFNQDNEIASFTQEFRAVFDNGGDITGMFGVFYADIQAETLVAGSFPGDFFGFPGVLVTLLSADDEQTENYALFGELEWQITERMRLLIGARYDDESIDNDISSSTLFTPPLVTLPATGGKTSSDFDAFLPKAQLTYDWNDNIGTSVTFSKGYRSGGAQLAIFGTNLPFDAEFTNNYEIAVRAAFPESRVTLNLNAYFIDWTDQQVSVPLLVAFPGLADQIPPGVDPSTLSATVNAGESEVLGAEVELTWTPSDSLDFFLSAGYSDTEFVDFPVGGGADFDGSEFRFAPNVSAAAGVSYEHSSGLFVSGNVSYSDGQYSANDNAPGSFSPSYTVVNLRAGYRFEHFTIAAFANNLFDEEYITYEASAFNQGQGGAEQVLGVQVTAGF